MNILKPCPNRCRKSFNYFDLVKHFNDQRCGNEGILTMIQNEDLCQNIKPVCTQCNKTISQKNLLDHCCYKDQMLSDDQQVIHNLLQ